MPVAAGVQSYPEKAMWCQRRSMTLNSSCLMTPLVHVLIYISNTRGSKRAALILWVRPCLRAYRFQSFYFTMAETAQPKGAYDPRLYSSTQPYPVAVQVIRPYNASPNRRPTCLRFLYAFIIAGLVWFAGAAFFRSMVHFIPWVSWLRFGPSFVLMIS